MKLILVIVFITINQFSFSQCLDNYGKEFYISFISSGNLSITSKVNTSGTIVNLNTGYTQNFSVTANDFTIISIPAIEIYNTTYNITANKSIIVKSNDPISIHSFNGGIASSDAALIYPIEALGTEYIAMGWGRTFLTNNFNFAPVALIVATQDNTIVEINPTSELSNGQLINIPFTITLNKGQTYSVASKEDISGTIIKVQNGNKPIAVFCGQRGVQIPINFTFADHIFEQIVPITKLGNKFITPVLKGRGKNFIKIAATQNNTVLKIDGAVVTILNKRQVYKFETTNIPKYIETDKSVLVGLFGTSYSYDSLLGNNMGDPTFIIVHPTFQTLKEIFFETPKLDSIKLHKICVTVTTTEKDKTFFDGVNIGNRFIPVIGNPNFSIATFDLLIGKHKIINDSGITVYINGYGFHQAYGCSAGTGLNDLFSKAYFECNNISSDDTFTVRVCKGQNIFKIISLQNNSAYTWDFGDGTPTVQTDGSILQKSHIYENLGNYTVTLFVENCNQITQIRKLKILVYEPLLTFLPVDTLIKQGTSIILNPNVDNTIIAYFWQPNYQINTTNTKYPIVKPLINTKYSLTVTDTLGCKNVNDFLVKVYNGLFMPNVFTPNNDGINDEFKIPNLFYVNLIDFSIYNKWGQVVFKTTDINKGWDGKFKNTLQENDTYVWKIKYRDLDNMEKFEKGTIILVK